MGVNGRRHFNQVEALLHGLLHAHEQMHVTEEDDRATCTDINELMDEMMKESEFKDKVEAILKKYPAKGLVKQEKGLVKSYE